MKAVLETLLWINLSAIVVLQLLFYSKMFWFTYVS